MGAACCKDVASVNDFPEDQDKKFFDRVGEITGDMNHGLQVAAKFNGELVSTLMLNIAAREDSIKFLLEELEKSEDAKDWVSTLQYIAVGTGLVASAAAAVAFSGGTAALVGAASLSTGGYGTAATGVTLAVGSVYAQMEASDQNLIWKDKLSEEGQDALRADSANNIVRSNTVFEASSSWAALESLWTICKNEINTDKKTLRSATTVRENMVEARINHITNGVFAGAKTEIVKGLQNHSGTAINEMMGKAKSLGHTAEQVQKYMQWGKQAFSTVETTRNFLKNSKVLEFAKLVGGKSHIKNISDQLKLGIKVQNIASKHATQFAQNLCGKNITSLASKTRQGIDAVMKSPAVQTAGVVLVLAMAGYEIYQIHEERASESEEQQFVKRVIRTLREDKDSMIEAMNNA